jgi:Arc/MetJ family transcription regulator
MTRITLELDDAHLAAAARELGTTSADETITAALAHIALRRQRAEAFGAMPAAADLSLAGHFLG